MPLLFRPTHGAATVHHFIRQLFIKNGKKNARLSHLLYIIIREEFVRFIKKCSTLE